MGGGASEGSHNIGSTFFGSSNLLSNPPNIMLIIAVCNIIMNNTVVYALMICHFGLCAVLQGYLCYLYVKLKSFVSCVFRHVFHSMYIRLHWFSYKLCFVIIYCNVSESKINKSHLLVKREREQSIETFTV